MRSIVKRKIRLFYATAVHLKLLNHSIIAKTISQEAQYVKDLDLIDSVRLYVLLDVIILVDGFS